MLILKPTLLPARDHRPVIGRFCESMIQSRHRAFARKSACGNLPRPQSKEITSKIINVRVGKPFRMVQHHGAKLITSSSEPSSFSRYGNLLSVIGVETLGLLHALRFDLIQRDTRHL
jgi:hypothetical protein